MLSERLMVDRRCAMEIVVLFPFNRDDSAELTRVSDSASRADVARSCQQFPIRRNRLMVNSHLHPKSICRGF